KNYSTLFSTAGKAWASALERLPRKYGWCSSGHKQQTGFTIIEVVLVLAIAGLIFLMVFIALPALQRSQRDAQRKNDISRIKSALESYKSNNRGRLPSDTQIYTEFSGPYLVDLDGGFNDPDGSRYVISPIEIGRNVNSYYTHRDVSGEMMRQVFFVRNARCANGTTETYGGSNNFSILIRLEGGGNYCIDG
ncbi:MAG: type II secretion system protein, partial [Candidatus Sacchiramonaceae bacterium]|nr:type II secretion system protein [Candidatus Saccharimonadaceae bacterium]